MSQKVYEPKSFWAQKGKEPAEKYTIDKKIKIIEALSGIRADSILEIGAGDGELSRILKRYLAPKEYTVIDISKDRLDNLDVECTKIAADYLDWNNDKKFDLVISAHCLLHVTPDRIAEFATKMFLQAKKYVINIDPIDFATPTKWAWYNFPHDYFAIWGYLQRPDFDIFTFKQIEPKVGLWKIEKSIRS